MRFSVGEKCDPIRFREGSEEQFKAAHNGLSQTIKGMQ
jgi:hypothetical protein